MPNWSRKGSRTNRRGGRSGKRWKVSWIDDYGITHTRTLKSPKVVEEAREIFEMHGYNFSVEVI